MATRFCPRSFFRVDVLRRIELTNLIALLAPFREYLQTCGFDFSSDAEGSIDYSQLAGILLNADERTPIGLIESLQRVARMGRDEHFDELQRLAFLNGISPGDEPTALDLAARIQVEAPEALERLEAQWVDSPWLKFEHFPARDNDPLSLHAIPDDLKELEGELGEWFHRHGRGPGASVQIARSRHEARFLIEHGRPCRRERTRRGAESSTLFFRPEITDVVVYDSTSNELRVRAETIGETRLYLAKFGQHLFGDPEHFVYSQKYTLEPLKTYGRQSLTCNHIPGLEWVWLREIQWAWPGAFEDVQINRGDDVFFNFERHHAGVPREVVIKRAILGVKLSGIEQPRKALITPPNAASFGSGEEAAPIEEFLRRQGFIQLGKTADEHETADLFVEHT